MRRGSDQLLVALVILIAWTAGLVSGYLLATSDARADAVSVEARQ